ncbi:MAG: hypothetical protein H7Z75_04470 [Ferruginibacter sp.]|nr:hypothetical protein [Cytophagales bacterium]
MQVPINDVKGEMLAAIYCYYPKKIHSWLSFEYQDGVGLKPLLERIHQTHQRLDWAAFLAELKEKLPESHVTDCAIPSYEMDLMGYIEVRLMCVVSISIKQIWYSLHFYVSAVVPYCVYFIESRRDLNLPFISEKYKDFFMQLAELRREQHIMGSFEVDAHLKQSLIETHQAIQTHGHEYGISVEDWDRNPLFQQLQFLAEHYQDYQPTRSWDRCPAVFQDTLDTVLACQQRVIGYRAFPVALLGEVVPGISTRFKQDGEVTMGDLIFNFDPMKF